MACPTCGHTMHGLGPDCYWCPRCGTTKYGSNTAVPTVACVLAAADEENQAVSVYGAPFASTPWEARIGPERECRGETPINALAGLYRPED